MKKERLMELAGVVTEAKEKLNCPFCEKKFGVGKLLTHIKKVHTDDYSDMFEGIITEEDDEEEKDMMKCPLCDEEFEHGKVLKHIKADHKDARDLVQDKMKEDDDDDDDDDKDDEKED